MFDPSAFWQDDWMNPTLSPSNTSVCYPDIGQRDRCLVTLMNAAGMLINQICDLDDPVLPVLPYAAWVQLGHAIVILSRIVIYSREIGDSTLFFESISTFKNGLERFGRKMEATYAGQRRRLPAVFGALPGRLAEISMLVDSDLEDHN